MEKKKNTTHSLSRRGFLKTSTLGGGGMLIGFNLFTACKNNVTPPVDLSQLDYNDFNAFIKISNEGKVTIFSPNPEIGQGVKTSMPMLIAEELDVAWKDVFVKQGVLDSENYTRQVAGGSQSLRKSWKPLRQTGATARQMLVNAAAARWGVDASDCYTEAGIVFHSSGKQLGYGALVNEAALLEVPENVQLKEPENFRIIGKEIGNVDIDKIVTGKPLFGLDYKSPGMQYAAVLRPPAFGQALVSFDASGAEQVNGVNQVIQFGNKVAVLGSTTWAVLQGKKALKAIWEEETPLEDSAFHNKILLELLKGKKFKTLRKDGDVAAAFATADEIFERTYESPFLPHNCMEPMNFYANVTDEMIHLVGPIQTPEGTAKRVAKLLGRDVKDIQLEMTRMGGGFGRRLYGDFVMEAAEVSKLAKKAVKLIFSREDDMTAGIYRPSTKYHISAAIKNGEITGYHLKEAAVGRNMSGTISNFFPAGAIENYQVDVAHYQGNITTGAWRAPYTNFLAFAEQSFFDELAMILKKDRVQMHLDLLEEVIGTKDKRIQYSPERFQAVIRLAVEKSNWGKKEKGVYQGFSAYYSHNTHVAEVAEVVLKDGIPQVNKVTCAVDCGVVVNPLGAKNQVVGGVIDGIGHAMYGELSFKNGKPQSQNFDQYRLIRMGETPQVDVHFIRSDIAPTGLGEPTLPPAGGAVANAIFAATGNRMTRQPFIKNMAVDKIIG